MVRRGAMVKEKECERTFGCTDRVNDNVFLLLSQLSSTNIKIYLAPFDQGE